VDQAVTGFSSPRPRFNPRVNHMEFVVVFVFVPLLWCFAAHATNASYSPV
jgi:hypothetical protein